MLGTQDLMAFVATAKASDALTFYRDVLGLKLLEDSPFALAFESGQVLLRVQKVKAHQPLPYTALGWKVQDIAAAVTTLTERGVKFERFAGLQQDDRGVWASPSGARIAWFKDPDGNVLSLTEV